MLINHIFNWLVPPLCVHCDREGAWWCTESQTAIAQASIITDLTIKHIDQVFIRADYDQSPIADLIQKLKYHYWTGAEETLPALLKPLTTELTRLPPDTLIVPVPLHPTRQRERGFNQSYLIARAVHQLTGWPIAAYVVRVRATQPQATLKAEQRLINVLNAFQPGPTKLIPNSVLLVDDVITTGATIQACATALRQSGARSISALALAKG